MRTAHSPIVCTYNQPPAVSAGGGCPQVNKLEQVFGLGDPMSLTGGGPQMNMFEQVSGLGQMPLVEQGGAQGSLYGEVQCIMVTLGPPLGHD